MNRHFVNSPHFVSRFGRLGLVGGCLIRLGWAVPAGLCRLIRFFSFRGTATAGFFLFSRNLLLRLFLRDLFRLFCTGMGSTGSTAGVPASGAAGSAFSTVSRAAARRSAISSSILSKDTTTSPGSGIVTPACSCGGVPAVKSGGGASVPGISVAGASGAIASPSAVGIFLFSSTC